MVARVVSDALQYVWKVLQPLNVPMAVMGGIALARWQYVRATRDVDILLALGNVEVATLLEILSAEFLRANRSPPTVRIGTLDVLQLTYEAPETFLPIQVDLLLAESAYHRLALARAIHTRLPEIELEVNVLTCEDLILHKLLAGRLIDHVDAAALLRANDAALDYSYLKQWTESLGVEPAFERVWYESFPERPMPK